MISFPPHPSQASCPELACLRDLLFLLKLFLSPSAKELPEPRPPTHPHAWRAADARLTWSHREGDRARKLEVRGFGRVLRVVEGGAVEFLEAVKTFFGGTQRNKPRAPPSGADAALFLGHEKPGDVAEDEVLGKSSAELLQTLKSDTPSPAKRHRSLRWREPDKAPLSAADAELLVTYLTAPYLRIPLLLAFFSDAQRIGALASPHIQAVLEAALFEPGPWQPEPPLPTHVPPKASERASVLGTPLGLLFNELVHAPAFLLSSLTAMVGTALDMETGTHEGGSAAVSSLPPEPRPPPHPHPVSPSLNRWFSSSRAFPRASRPTPSLPRGTWRGEPVTTYSAAPPPLPPHPMQPPRAPLLAQSASAARRQRRLPPATHPPSTRRPPPPLRGRTSPARVVSARHGVRCRRVPRRMRHSPCTSGCVPRQPALHLWWSVAPRARRRQC